jgi:hypothetical protein
MTRPRIHFYEGETTMKSKLRFTLSSLMLAAMLMAAYAVTAHAQTGASHNQRGARKGGTVEAAGINASVTGGGTGGQITKWTSPGTLGDTVITENKYGQIGIGTTAPTSKLTVAGVIESTTGGVRFPDGTVQTTAAAIQATSPALQPFAQALSASFSNNPGGISATLNVPAGKRLVIETASLLVNLPVGQFIDAFTIRTSVGGQLADYSLFPNSVPSGGANLSAFGITQPLKIYADPGTLVTATLVRGESAGGALNTGFYVVISGYLVDAQ